MKKYTEKQLRIISGEIPLSSCDGHMLRFLYQNALANNDTDLIRKIEERMRQNKEEQRLKNTERGQKRDAGRKAGTFKWKQPKFGEYTEHQKAIVRGEIPLEQVHTKELIHIHLKAQKAGDYELAERTYDLISTRHQNAETNHRKNVSERVRHYVGNTISSYERAILDGEIDYLDLEPEDLEKLVEITEKEDNDSVETAKKMLLYKTVPASVYVCQTNEEALRMIEQMTGFPIRRPKTWFEDE